MDIDSIIARLESLNILAENAVQSRPVPQYIDVEFKDILWDLLRYFGDKQDGLSQSMIDKYLSRDLNNVSISQFLEILREIRFLLYYQTQEKKAIAQPINSESRIEKKLKAFENELKRLGSNPALEKKVAKLEEELHKVRVDSMKRLKVDEKEQKNQVKKFESADVKVFVIMPFNPFFDDVWEGGIKRACDSENMGCLRVDKVELSTWITEDIKKYLDLADIVITDITGNNPNVMFELGWALAKNKKQIVIRQKDDTNKVPFDVKDIRYISYTNSWSGIEKLCSDICSFIQNTSEALDAQTAKKKKDPITDD